MDNSSLPHAEEEGPIRTSESGNKEAEDARDDGEKEMSDDVRKEKTDKPPEDQGRRGKKFLRKHGRELGDRGESSNVSKKRKVDETSTSKRQEAEHLLAEVHRSSYACGSSSRDRFQGLERDFPHFVFSETEPAPEIQPLSRSFFRRMRYNFEYIFTQYDAMQEYAGQVSKALKGRLAEIAGLKGEADNNKRNIEFLEKKAKNLELQVTAEKEEHERKTSELSNRVQQKDQENEMMKEEVESLKKDKVRLDLEVQNLKAALDAAEIARDHAEQNAAAAIGSASNLKQQHDIEVETVRAEHAQEKGEIKRENARRILMFCADFLRQRDLSRMPGYPRFLFDVWKTLLWDEKKKAQGRPIKESSLMAVVLNDEERAIVKEAQIQEKQRIEAERLKAKGKSVLGAETGGSQPRVFIPPPIAMGGSSTSFIPTAPTRTTEERAISPNAESKSLLLPIFQSFTRNLCISPFWQEILLIHAGWTMNLLLRKKVLLRRQERLQRRLGLSQNLRKYPFLERVDATSLLRSICLSVVVVLTPYRL